MLSNYQYYKMAEKIIKYYEYIIIQTVNEMNKKNNIALLVMPEYIDNDTMSKYMYYTNDEALANMCNSILGLDCNNIEIQTITNKYAFLTTKQKIQIHIHLTCEFDWPQKCIYQSIAFENITETYKYELVIELININYIEYMDGNGYLYRLNHIYDNNNKMAFHIMKNNIKLSMCPRFLHKYLLCEDGLWTYIRFMNNKLPLNHTEIKKRKYKTQYDNIILLLSKKSCKVLAYKILSYI